MAGVNIVKSASMADFLARLQKDHGEGIGSFGGRLVNTNRIPTGLFPLDLALGGGLPIGKVSMIFGPESSSKTNIALLAIAQYQLLYPDEVCVFIDAEHALDPAWARLLGVNTDKLVVIQPSYAEQVVDIVESALYTADCGLVAVDSLAALVTTAEMERSAEGDTVGGTARVIGKLYRKTNLALGEAEKQDRHPTLIYINQIRSKIGVQYGNPETTPGGFPPRFQSNVILRVYGRNEFDKKISSTMPVKKEVKFVVHKWKCPIYSASGTFSMATTPHAGLKVGQCADFNTISEYLKAWGKFEKQKPKGWLILDEHYDTIEPFKIKCYEDLAFGAEVRKMIIDQVVASGEMLQGQPDEAPPEGLAA
jgi:recombination protein RecA